MTAFLVTVAVLCIAPLVAVATAARPTDPRDLVDRAHEWDGGDR